MVLLLKIALTCALLALLFQQVDRSALAAVLSNTRLEWVVLGIACGIPVMIASGLRWRQISSYLRVQIPRRFAVLSYMEAVAFNLLLPGSIGGDVIRVAKVTRARGHLRRNLVAILLDRAANLGILLAICLPGLLFISAGAEANALRAVLVVLLTAFVAAGAALMLAIRLRHLRRYRLVREVVYLAALSQRTLLPPSRIAVVAGWSLLAQGMAIAMFMASASAVGIVELSLVESAIATMLALLAAALPFTLAGLGVREGALIWTLMELGVGQAQAYSAAILFAACLILQAIPGLLISLAGSAKLSQARAGSKV